MTEGERVAVVFGVWVLLGVGTALFMYRGSPESRRVWFPRLTVFAAAVFVALVYWAVPDENPVFLVLVVAAITLLNLMISRFCPKCGTFYQRFGPQRATFCRKCGAELPTR